jgi:hypothetical protein
MHEINKFPFSILFSRRKQRVTNKSLLLHYHNHSRLMMVIGIKPESEINVTLLKMMALNMGPKCP